MSNQTFMGFTVVESPLLRPTPNMQLSKSFAALMPQDFVVETNKWMLDFFGATASVYLSEQTKTLYVNPGGLAQLRLACRP